MKNVSWCLQQVSDLFLRIKGRRSEKRTRIVFELKLMSKIKWMFPDQTQTTGKIQGV